MRQLRKGVSLSGWTLLTDSQQTELCSRGGVGGLSPAKRWEGEHRFPT